MAKHFRSAEQRELDRKRARWQAGLDPDGHEEWWVLAGCVVFTLIMGAGMWLALTMLMPRASYTPAAGTNAVSVRDALCEYGTSGEVMFG